MSPSPRPNPAATPADAIDPGRFTDAAMPLKPMKKKPKVPTISARSRLPSACASTVPSERSDKGRIAMPGGAQG